MRVSMCAHGFCGVCVCALFWDTAVRRTQFLKAESLHRKPHKQVPCRCTNSTVTMSIWLVYDPELHETPAVQVLLDRHMRQRKTRPDSHQGAPRWVLFFEFYLEVPRFQPRLTQSVSLALRICDLSCQLVPSQGPLVSTAWRELMRMLLIHICTVGLDTCSVADLKLVAEQFRVTAEVLIAAEFTFNQHLWERAGSRLRSRPTSRILRRPRRHPAPPASVHGPCTARVQHNRR